MLLGGGAKAFAWAALYALFFAACYAWSQAAIVVAASLALLVGLRAIAVYGLSAYGGAWRGLLLFLVFMWGFELLYLLANAWWLFFIRDLLLLLAFASVVYYVSRHILIVGEAAGAGLYLASLAVLFLVSAASLVLAFFAPREIYVGRYAVGMILNGFLFSLSLPVLESFRGGLMARPWSIWLSMLAILVLWNTAKLAMFMLGAAQPQGLFDAVWGANYVLLAASLKLKAFPG